MNDVLLRRSLKPQSGAYTPEEEEETVLEYYEYVCTHGDPSLELRGGDDGDGAAVFAELPLQTLLDRHCRETRALLTTKIRALVGGFEWMLRLTQQVIVGVSLVFEGESPVTDVVQVLQPLEVGNRHTASVQVHVLTHEGRRERG